MLFRPSATACIRNEPVSATRATLQNMHRTRSLISAPIQWSGLWCPRLTGRHRTLTAPAASEGDSIKESVVPGMEEADCEEGHQMLAEVEDGRMHKFPHIESLAKFARQTEFMPYLPAKMRFEGTVKLHGTHADLVQSAPNASLRLQTRNRILKDSDADFCGLRELTTRDEAGLKVMAAARAALGIDTGIMISGELCGKGVQKDTAISRVERFFVIFDIWADGHFQDMSKLGHIHNVPSRMYNIRQFPTYSIDILKDDVQAVREPVDLVTAEVGRCCPVALQLGAEGPGEGIVWKCVEPELQRTCGSRLWFKSKAVEFMTETRKPRALRPPPAAAQAEAAAAARQFVKECVTERRLQQGLEYLAEFGHPLQVSSMGIFLKWVVEDAMREEGADIPSAVRKQYTRRIMEGAKEWFQAEVQAAAAAGAAAVQSATEVVQG